MKGLSPKIATALSALCRKGACTFSEEVMPTDSNTTAVALTERGLEPQPPRQNPGASKLLRLPAVTARVGMRRTSIYALIKAGKFPLPVKIGKASAWLDDEITQWIEELKIDREVAKRSGSC